MKMFSFFLIFLLLTSCTVLCPQQKQALLQDQQSFSQAFDDFQLTHRINTLRSFKSDYPDSIWAERAETIILYSQELDQCKLQLDKMHNFQRQQTLEFEKLKKVNQQLSEMIEQLKSSLIQSEKHLK